MMKRPLKEVHHYRMDLLESDSSLFCSIELDAKDLSAALTRAQKLIGARHCSIYEDGEPLGVHVS